MVNYFYGCNRSPPYNLGFCCRQRKKYLTRLRKCMPDTGACGPAGGQICRTTAERYSPTRLRKCMPDTGV